MTRTRAVFLVLAGPALLVGLMTVPARAAVPDCIVDTAVATVIQRFDEVAPTGSAMRSEGDAFLAQQEIRGMGRSGQTLVGLAEIAADYGYQWDCASTSFVRSGGSTAVPSNSTTSTTTAPITSTTVRATTSTTRSSLPANGASTTTTPKRPPTTAAPTTVTTTAPSTTTTAAPVENALPVSAPAAADTGGPRGVLVILLAGLSLLGMGGGYLVSRRFSR